VDLTKHLKPLAELAGPEPRPNTQFLHVAWKGVEGFPALTAMWIGDRLSASQCSLLRGEVDPHREPVS
jgi:hypothetical protein